MKSSWLKFIFLVCVTVVLVGCNSKYKEGYRDGERAGYSKGHSEGYSQGKRDGYLSGTKTTVGESFVPSLAGAILIAIFILSFLVFKRVFDKSMKEIVNDLALFLHNLYSFFILKRKASKLEKSKDNYAALSAKVSSLGLQLELNDIIQELKHENEVCLILIKVEQYLTEISELSRHDSNSSIRTISDLTLSSKGISQTERKNLLNTILMLLTARLSEIKNLTAYKKTSLQKISNICDDYIKHKNRYFFKRAITKVAVVTSVVINVVFVLIVGIVCYYAMQQ